jgi:peroxiredoxin
MILVMWTNPQNNPPNSSLSGKIQAPFLMMLAGLALIIAAIVILVTQPAGSSGIGPVQVGKPLYNFNLNDINNKAVALSDFQGKIVLVNVWATWCPPCKAEMPDLQAFFAANQHKGLVILAIDAGDGLSDVKDFARQNQLTFPILLDPQTNLVKRLNIYDYPTSVIVDRQGIVKSIQIGRYTPEALKSDLLPLLNSQ